jgi:stage V sporulation protein SpoVS
MNWKSLYPSRLRASEPLGDRAHESRTRAACRSLARRIHQQNRWSLGLLLAISSVAFPASANPTRESEVRAEVAKPRRAKVAVESSPARRLTVEKPVAEKVENEVPKVEYNSKWQGAYFGGYLTPKNLDVDSDGGVDFVVHLNGAMMADKEWRESGLNAIIASVAIREVVGTAGYARMFAHPSHLDSIVKGTFAQMKKNGEKRTLHVRRMLLVSWSAGVGGINQVLGNAKVAEKVDAVVLLDSLHAGYTDPSNGVGFVPKADQAVMGLGSSWVDRKSIQKFVRFANQAKDNKKVFVVATSSILPPNYASCTETAEAVLEETETPWKEESEVNALGMKVKKKADDGQLHVRAFAGGGPHDHFDQLHLVGEMVRKFVVPVWNAKKAP